MPALRNALKPPARVIRRGSHILRGAPAAGGGGLVSLVQENDGNVGGTRQTSVTVTTTGNLAAGNVVTVELTSNNIPTFTPPDGTWTSVVRAADGTTAVVEAFRHLVQAGEVGAPGSWVFTVGATTRSMCWHAAEWSGVDTANVVDGTPTTLIHSATTAIDVPTITVGDGAAVVVAACFSGGAGVTTTFTPPSGFTEIADQATSTTLTESCETVDWKSFVTGAATGTMTITAGASTCSGIGYALKAAAGGGALSRTAADTASATDAATRLVTVARTASDTAAATDAAPRTWSAVRAVADTAQATDTASRAALTLSRTAADTASATDAAPRALTLARTAADTASATDSVVGTGAGNNRTAADTASASDSATRTLGLAGRTAADTASATDSATRAAPKTRTTADTATATDAATRTWSAARTAADTATATDAAPRTASFARTASDTASATDAATRTAPRTRTAADTASATDAAAGSSAGNLQRTATDTAAATDAAARGAISRARSAADTALATDAVTRTAPRARTGADTASATDAAVAVVNHFFARTASDTASATDAVVGNVSSFTVGRLTAAIAAAALTGTTVPTSTLTASVTRAGPS